MLQKAGFASPRGAGVGRPEASVA
ncbi:hypothetical protein E2C01_081443 [Portunus trituberculatus]|uniref:Uncharacterized protein n=1 Tax=Portunus trituberculatus TaxID=210409 RepID=A0A5B7IPT3_PORTR|nr:hypothetical protein [Portunus trituberculatus]